VEILEGETIDIMIEVSDARGDGQVAYEETLNESREYNVPIVLSPQKDGLIRVFYKGPDDKYVEYQTIPISYQSLQ
jgi:serine/threonine-protein kinase